MRDIVLSDIRKYAKMTAADKEALTKQVLEAMRQDKAGKAESGDIQLEKIQHRIEEIDELVKSLYTDKVRGDIPATLANKMLVDFESELHGLEQKRNALQSTVREQREKKDQIEHWTALIQKYAAIDDGTRQVAVELVESITVSAYYMVDGKKMQDVTIKYRFVGNLDEAVKKDGNAA